MTKVNQKRLYDHYITTKQTENAAMILKAYPNFAKDEAPVDEPEPEKKKKMFSKKVK